MGSNATTVTVVTDTATTVPGLADVAAGRVLVDEGALVDALGWTLKPAGLCRDDVCVPVADPDALRAGARVDVAMVARALGRPVVADPPAGLVAVALPAEERRRAVVGLTAPDFVLPDLSDQPRRFSEWRGRKRLLVTFASWCGCRYDLPGWQALHDELADNGFTVVAVAVDQRADDVRPFAEGITLPLLYDPQHLLTELFAISNVPTVVWVDEDDGIVRPNAEAFGTDLFQEFTGVAATPHLDAVRRWVRHGVVPESPPDAVGELSEDEVAARLHFRVAAEAHRRGDTETTRAHLDEAARLAPDDLTIWRAAMPLVGEDPFGPGFFERYEAWKEAGSPYHGQSAMG